MFRHEGYLTYSNISKLNCLKILDLECRKNLETSFKKEILDDVWEHCDSNNFGEVTLHAFAQTFMKAFRTLT